MEVTYKGVVFDVEYEYQAGEPEITQYGDGSGHPGCGEYFSVRKISHKGTDFKDFFEEECDEFGEASYQAFRDLSEEI